MDGKGHLFIGERDVLGFYSLQPIDYQRSALKNHAGRYGIFEPASGLDGLPECFHEAQLELEDQRMLIVRIGRRFGNRYEIIAAS